jgi:hypothetical protein
MQGQSNQICYEEVALLFIDWFYDHNFKHLIHRQRRCQLEDCKTIARLGTCNKTLWVTTHQNCELYEIFIPRSWYHEMVKMRHAWENHKMLVCEQTTYIIYITYCNRF